METFIFLQHAGAQTLKTGLHSNWATYPKLHKVIYEMEIFDACLPITELFVCGTDNSLINVRANLINEVGLNEKEHKGTLWWADLQSGATVVGTDLEKPIPCPDVT